MGAFRFTDRDTARRMDILPPETTARTRVPRQMAKPDIVDAEFETVAAGTRRQAHATFNDNRRSARERNRPKQARRTGGAVAGIVAAIGVGERLLQNASPRAFAGLVAGTFASVFLFAVAFAGFQPHAEPQGLRVAGVSTSLDDRDGMQILSVYGRVVNTGPQTLTAPVLLVDVVNGGHVTTSRLKPQALTIAAGQSSYFSARLPHRGGKMPEVRVSLGPVGAPAN